MPSQNLTNPYSGEFRPTELEQYLVCPRSYYISKLLHLQSAQANVAMTFGTAIHEALATFYKGAKLSEMLTTFASNWTIGGDTVRNAANASLILANYFNLYQTSRPYVKAEEVEVRFRLPMPNGTILTGTIDRIFRDGSSIAPHDTKTSSSSLTDFFWKRYDNSFQLGAYDYACRQVFGGCDHVVVDGICVKQGGTGEKFNRKPFIRTDLQREEWLNTYLRITNEILNNIHQIKTAHPSFISPGIPKPANPLDFYQNQTSCDKWGGCPYLGVCKHGLDHTSVVVELVKIEETKED